MGGWKRITIRLLLVPALIACLMEGVLAEPNQAPNMERDGETEAVINVLPNRSPSISFSNSVMLANLILAAINILLTYWMGRKHSL